MDYLIFVPPRSKSSWISNFFTYGRSYCYHEALTMCATIKQFADMKKGNCVTGNADSSMFIFPRQPNAKIIVVRRDKNEVEDDLREMFDKQVAFHTAKNCEDGAQWLLEKPNVIEIDFEKIKEEESCERMWEHCIDSEPFDRERWKMLSNFKIQVDRIDMSGGTIHELFKNVRGY
mgnify:CR=1 FL=1